MAAAAAAAAVIPAFKGKPCSHVFIFPGCDGWHLLWLPRTWEVPELPLSPARGRSCMDSDSGGLQKRHLPESRLIMKNILWQSHWKAHSRRGLRIKERGNISSSFFSSSHIFFRNSYGALGNIGRCSKNAIKRSNKIGRESGSDLGSRGNIDKGRDKLVQFFVVNTIVLFVLFSYFLRKIHIYFLVQWQYSYKVWWLYFQMYDLKEQPWALSSCTIVISPTFRLVHFW